MRSFRDILRSGILASVLVTAAFAETPREHYITIAAGPAPQSLEEFIRQTGVQLLYDPEAVQRVRTHAVSGRFTVAAALARMLESTGITYELVNERTVAVVAPSPANAALPRTAKQSAEQDSSRRRIAGGRRGRPELPKTPFSEPLDEVEVVGTFIRGIAEPVGSTVIKMRRREIERTGHSRMRDVLRVLPQNFGGGASEDTFAGDEAASNVARGTGWNLRGVGSGSTIVLLDERRVAPSGSKGSYVDVSLFPLIAIEEITILPDGASMAYGADPVGGIVNLSLRERYQGRETRMRIGSVTSGHQYERQFSQLVGAAWDAGNALLAFEYSDRSALPGSDRAQMASDLRPFGGDNFDTRNGNPGTLVIGSRTWAIPRGQDGRSLTATDLVPDTANLNNRQAGRDIVGDEELLSALATVRHEATDELRLYADLLLSRRDATAQGPAFQTVLPVPSTNPFYVNPLAGSFAVPVAYDLGSDLGPTTFRGDVRGANTAVGASLDIRRGWHLTTHATYSATREHVRTGGLADFSALAAALADPDPVSAFNPFGDGSHTHPDTIAGIRAETHNTSEASIRGMSFIASGPAMRAPGGDVQLALGADYRRDSFDSTLETLSRSDPDGSMRAARSSLDRNFRSAFAELLIPLAGHPNRRTGVERLQLSIAGRLDSYAGFDAQFSPKLGVSWSPIRTLTLRGSRSESFRPPTLPYLDESANRSTIVPLADPQAPLGVSSTLLWLGENADLRPETAVTWAFGASFRSEEIPGLQIDANYFDIEFEDRIRIVAATPSLLLDPAFADIVHRVPDASLRQDVCIRSVFIGRNGDCLNAPIDLIVDARTNNAETVRTRGIDLLASWQRTSRIGAFEVDLNATKVLEYARAERKTSPFADVLDTEDDPLDFRLRGSLSWQLDPIETTLGVSYSDGYRDTLSQPQRAVDSWTTFDLWLALRPWKSGPLAGAELSLSAQNLFDELPPFVNNPAGLGYDPANGELSGRFVSLQLGVDW